VLAPESPISLQAHPSIAQAEAGFAREEAAGIAIDAPDRNYKDRNHKPEMVYALSDPFLALAGFRPVAETRETLNGIPAAAPLLGRLTGDGALRDTFAWLLSGDPEVAELTSAISVLAGDTERGASWDTVRRLSRYYPGDPGIPISLLLHTVTLAPGEAIYLPAGNIHAYLHGVGVELLASSDNVLRGGLTAKHIDVPGLLEILDFRPLPAPYLRPTTPQPGVQVFTPDVPDFVLTVVAPDAAERGVDISLSDGRPAIAFCASGAITLDGAEMTFSLLRGQAAYISGEPRVRIGGHGHLFLAS
jgi:mannose-6-phosphate isomerase